MGCVVPSKIANSTSGVPGSSVPQKKPICYYIHKSIIKLKLFKIALSEKIGDFVDEY